jgi:predicted nucleic acid-binding protein
VSDGQCYWDSSAVLSLLLPDSNSSIAMEHSELNLSHLISSVGAAEVYAVLARLERGHAISVDDARAARARFESGRWRYAVDVPSRALLRDLARKWLLKGADLWHLAAAITLRLERPRLQILTFDAALAEAARGEDLSAT